MPTDTENEHILLHNNPISKYLLQRNYFSQLTMCLYIFLKKLTYFYCNKQNVQHLEGIARPFHPKNPVALLMNVAAQECCHPSDSQDGRQRIQERSMKEQKTQFSLCGAEI